MHDAVWIALLGTVGALFASTIAPAILLWLTGRARRTEREEDYKRQDDVARRLEQNQQQAQSELVAIKSVVVETKELANNSYTEVLKAQLVAYEQLLVFQRVDAKGRKTTEDIIVTTEMITKLRGQILDREAIAEKNKTTDSAHVRAADATEKLAEETKRIADVAEGSARQADEAT